MQNGAAQRAQYLEGGSVPLVCGAAIRIYGMSPHAATEAKKVGSLAGAYFSKSGKLRGKDLLKILGVNAGRQDFARLTRAFQVLIA